MRRKVLNSLFVLLITLVITVGSAYAFWDSLFKTDNQTVVVGDGVETTLTVVDIVPVGKFLVPSTAIIGANDITSITLTYNVKVNQKAIDVGYTDLTITVSGDYSSLLNIQLPATTTMKLTDTLITIVIFLDAPANLAEYNAVKNQSFSFILIFTVS